jgi:hypothetical protein
MIENLFVSDQDLRWRTWQQKSRLADQRSEKRMKIVFFVVAGILLAWALYVVFTPVPVGQRDRSPGKVAKAMATPLVYP